MGGLPRQHAALHRLAALSGVLTSYRDWKQQAREADPEVLTRVLRELDVPIEHPGEADGALRGERARRWQDGVSPCAVARGGRPAEIEIRVAADRGDRFAAEVELEGGERRQIAGSLADLGVTGARTIAGEARVARSLSIPDVPDGYHRARVEIGGRAWETLIVACPEQAYKNDRLAGSWGVFAPTYALRSEQTAGAGSLAELGELAERVAALGGSIVGTLPLTAGYYDEPFEPSPYSPVSRLFWNELFVDLQGLARDGLAGLHGASADGGAEIREALADAAGRRAALSAAPLVEYRAQMAHVRRVLESLSRAAWKREGARAELEDFLRDHPRAGDYAEFRAAVERHRASWLDWPETPRSGVLASGDFDDEVRRYHVFCQHVLSRQLGAFKDRHDRAGLYLDLPVGVSRGSYDTWRERDAFALGCSVGAPPDALFLGGQNWALPPLHPERIRARGYRYFIECVRAQLEHATALRIDHVMGLHRLYWIPDGVPATEGVYVRYPHHELYAILILESHRQRCELIGEDLGTVPDEVPAEMERAGMGRLYVAQFALPAEDGDAPPPPGPAAVASFGTHDTPTFAGFWAGRDIDTRRSLGLISDQEAAAERAGRRAARRVTEAFLLRHRHASEPGTAGVMRGLLEYLGASEARLVLVSLDDLWLEPEPQNVPGTTTEHPNWRRRMQRDLGEVMSDPEVTRVLRAVNARRSERRPYP